MSVQTRDSKIVYRGPTAPVTSVAIGGQGGATIFAGCWDKNIWSWDRESRALGRTLKGHSDFVKVVISARLEAKDVSSPMFLHRHSLTGHRLSYPGVRTPRSLYGTPQQVNVCILCETRATL